MKIYGGYSIKQKQSINLIKQGIGDHLSEFSDYVSYDIKAVRNGVDNCFNISLRSNYYGDFNWKYTVSIVHNYIGESLHILDGYINLNDNPNSFERIKQFSAFFEYIHNVGWRNILSNYFTYLNKDLNNTIKYLKRLEGKDLWVKYNCICYNDGYSGYSWTGGGYVKILRIEDDVIDYNCKTLYGTNGSGSCNIYDIQLSNPLEVLSTEELLDTGVR